MTTTLYCRHHITIWLFVIIMIPACLSVLCARILSIPAQAKIESIPVGSYPVGIAINAYTQRVYVANQFSDTVSVINPATDSIDRTINVGKYPYAIAANPFTSRVYVTNRGSDSVSVIDTSTNTVLGGEIKVGLSPVGIAVNPSRSWVYVTNLDNGTVSVIDEIGDRVVKNVTVGKYPYGIAVNPITSKVYITDSGSDGVSVIDSRTNKVLGGVIKVGHSPEGIAVNPKTDRIYVANYYSNSIAVIDGASDRVLKTFEVGKYPVGIAVNAKTNKVYVTDQGSARVSVIDGSKNIVVSQVPVTDSLASFYNDEDPTLNIPLNVNFPLLANLLSVDSASNIVYVTGTGSDTVTAINGSSDKVSVGVSFSVNPPYSGDIICNGREIPTNEFYTYSNGTEIRCVAHPEMGKKFGTWSGSYANDPPTDSSEPHSLYGIVLNRFYGVIHGLYSFFGWNDVPIQFKASQYGTLTANFREALSLDQWLTIVLGPLSVISVVVGWLVRKRQRRYLNRLLSDIEKTFRSCKEDEKACKRQFEDARIKITKLLEEGRINDSYYQILDKKISDYTGKVDSKHDE